MDFDAVDAFDDIPDNTELTFEFNLGGRHDVWICIFGHNADGETAGGGCLRRR